MAPFHLLRRARRLFPFIERIFADGGYAGRKMALTVWLTGAWSLQIVSYWTLPVLRCCQNGGLSKGRLPGSVAIAAWPATLSATHHNRRCIHSPRHDPHHVRATCCKPLAMIC